MILSKIMSELISFAKEKYKKEKVRKNIEETVHQAFSTRPDKLLSLCMDAGFAEQLFVLASGQTIDVENLIKRGTATSSLNRDEIINELQEFGAKLINIFEQIAPERGKIPNAFVNFRNDLNAIRDSGRPDEQHPEPLFIVPHRRNGLLKHERGWIEEIQKLLAAEGQAVISQSVALSGLGGVGKTAMAVEYAYRFSEDYPGGVFWLQMDQGLGGAARMFFEAIDRHGVELGRWQDLPELDLIRKMVAFINQRPFKLLIFDNVESDELPKEFVKDLHLLVTTRRLGIPFHQVKMQIPSEQEALDIFLGYASLKEDGLSPEQREAALSICERVGCLPLGLEIMGQIVRRRPLVDAARDLDREVLDLEASTTAKELTSVKAALRLAEQEFKHPHAKEGLMAAGYLHAEGIDAALMAGILGIDHKDAGNVLAELADLSLMEFSQQNGYSIHRLTQEASRLMDEDQAVGIRTAEYLDRKVEEAAEQGTYKQAYHLIPHLVALASLAKAEMEEDAFPSGPLVNRLADFLRNSGYYFQTEKLLRKIIERVEKSKGREHPNYAAVLSNLALTLNMQGNYKDAEEFFRQTLEIDKNTIGDNHPHYAIGLNNLASVLKDQGNYKEAEKLHRKALEIEKKTVGENHHGYVTSLNNLALVLRLQGKYKEAEELYRKAIDIDNETARETHPSHAMHLGNLAVVLQRQGKYPEAENFFREALEIGKSTIGEEHPDYTWHLNNLALLLKTQGKYQEAERLFLQALEIDKKTVGEEHPSYASHLGNLAGVLLLQSRYDEAEKLFLEALENHKKTIGENHPKYALHLNNYLGILIKRGRYEAAEVVGQQALDISLRTLGPDHPQTKTIRENLAALSEVMKQQG